MTDAARSVAVLTDSTADIPPRMAQDEGVTVIKLVTTFPDGTIVRDGDLTQGRFFELMDRERTLPTTSQPPLGDFTSMYAGLLERFGHVVSIHLSSRLSGTLEAARIAAEAFGDRVQVVDSRSVSWGLGWPVVFAARAAKSGALVDEVVAIAERTRDRARFIVGLNTLDNLARGGRIGAVASFAGSLIDLKVLLTVDADGSLMPVARMRGTRAALRGTLDWVRREMHGAPAGAFCVLHAMSGEIAEHLRDALADAYHHTELFVVETGAVLSTHAGPAWAIGFIPEETDAP
jgi:DegV family protein with EDD domain